MFKALPKDYVVDPSAEETVESMIQFIALNDYDWATQKNNVGFNKADTGIGHYIAEATYYKDEALDVENAITALNLIHKYRRQLGNERVENFLKKPVFKQEPKTTPMVFVRNRRYVAVIKEQIRLIFSFKDVPDIVPEIKKSGFTGKHFVNDKPKGWNIIVAHKGDVDILNEIIVKFDFIVTPEAQKLLAEKKNIPEPTQPSHPVEGENPRKLRAQGSTAYWDFPFDREIINAVKAINGECYDRKFRSEWNKVRGSGSRWMTPVNEVSIFMIIETAEKYDFDIEQRFYDYYQRVTEKWKNASYNVDIKDGKIVVDPTPGTPAWFFEKVKKL